jgi:probable rRNA maturation factor
MKAVLRYESKKLKNKNLSETLLNKVFNDYLKDQIPTIYKTCKEAELNINFVSDAQIQLINNDLRGKNKPTDVLSWEMYDLEMKENMIFGEIYISDDYVIKQADKKRVELSDEITFLICHGFLHICGYTHENDQDEAEMNHETEILLDKLGIDYCMDII